MGKGTLFGFAMLGVFAVFALQVVLGGFVLSVIWGWFIVPVFASAPALGIGSSIGVSMVVSYLTIDSSKFAAERTSAENMKIFLGSLFYPIMVLATGFIVKLFT